MPSKVELEEPVAIAATNYLEDKAALSGLLATLATLPGLQINKVGTWLWIDGNTYSVKNKLKAMGFKWHGTKKMWYMALE